MEGRKGAERAAPRTASARRRSLHCLGMVKSTYSQRQKRREKKKADLLADLDQFSDGESDRDDGERPDRRGAASPPVADRGTDAAIAAAGDGTEEGDTGEDGDKVDGFAAALQGILRANIGDKKVAVLAKRKTARMKEIMKEREERNQRKQAAQQRRERKHAVMVIPDVSTNAKERVLKKIATKGVVALFNAISQYQREADGEAEKAEKERAEKEEREKAAKSRFMKLLKTGITGGGSSGDREGAEDGQPGWKALRSDYLMGANMKDWENEDLSDSDEDADEEAQARARIDAADGDEDDGEDGDDGDAGGDSDEDVFGDGADALTGDVAGDAADDGRPAARKRRRGKRGSGSAKKSRK